MIESIKSIRISNNIFLLLNGTISYFLIALLLGSLMYALNYNDTIWTTLDASRFHEMAETILKGLRPYVDYVDPKPPLLFYTVVLMDIITKPGSIDILVVTFLNVFSALLIWRIGWEDYGCFSGYIAGLLFLIGAVFSQGYLFYSEQFAVLFILGAYIFVRKEDYVKSGICLACACGYKQYALLALIPLLYYMHSVKARYTSFLIPLILVGSSFYLILFFIYGPEVGWNAIYYTFGIAKDYTTGEVTSFSTYVPQTPMAFVVNLIGSIAMVLPLLIFAFASVYHTGLRNIKEITLGLFVVSLLGTFIIRQYLHYWILLLPFLALLSSRVFEDIKKKNL